MLTNMAYQVFTEKLSMSQIYKKKKKKVVGRMTKLLRPDMSQKFESCEIN